MQNVTVSTVNFTRYYVDMDGALQNNTGNAFVMQIIFFRLVFLIPKPK
jgi:hypothetical protein